ncbi:hypothetical protein PHMEG_00023074, partial [Phytophthora megakarya]
MEALERLVVRLHLQAAIRGNRRVQELVDAADSVEPIYSAAALWKMEALERLVVRLHLQAAIRGNRRVQELVDAADSVESIYSAAIYPSPARQPAPTELEGTLRGYVRAAQSAQKAAEGRLLTEIDLRENAEGLLRSCHQEIAALRKSVENAQALTTHYKAVSDKFEANISDHSEVWARSENRVRAAEDTVADLNRQLKHVKSAFMAKIAANTTQLLERNRRLTTANRTLRSRVKLDQLDPDLLVPVTEGYSTGEIDWNMLEVCENTKNVLRDEYLNADPATSRDSLAELLAQARFDAERGESAGPVDPKKISADKRRTSPGTSAQEVAHYFQQKRAPAKSSASIPKRKASSPCANASQTLKRPRQRATDADVLEEDVDMEDHQDEVPVSKTSKLRRLKRSALFDSSESSGETGDNVPPYEYLEGEISGAEALTDLNSQSTVVGAGATEPLETSPPLNPTEEKSAVPPSHLSDESVPLSATSAADASPKDEPAESLIAPPPTVPNDVEVTQSVPSESSRTAEPSGGTQSTSPIVIQ